MKTKKVLSVLLVALMAFALSGMTAFAASITVKAPETDGTDNTTYTYYQILKANIDGDKVAYYVEDEAQATALAGTGVFTVTKVVSGDYWTVELVEGKTGEDIATALDGIKSNFTASAAFKAGEKQEVEDGYYLVVSSLGTKVVVDTFKAKEIDEKNIFPTIAKTVDPTSAAIGDTVTFTVTVTVPATVAEKDIVITDTADDGLTLDTAVTVAGAADSFTSATIEGGKITIPAANVKANAGKTLTLTYTAVVNDKIITDDTAAVNTAKNTVVLTYADFTSKEAEASVSTYAVKVKKTDGTDVITGAEFTLWDAETDGNQIKVTKKSDGVYYVEPNGSDVIEAGTATILGLDAKGYYLQEEVAPTGYNKLAAREAANVSTEDITEVEVVNKAGTELPSTGAMGTTIFYVVGILAILGAGVFMVTNKRIAKEEF